MPSRRGPGDGIQKVASSMPSRHEPEVILAGERRGPRGFLGAAQFTVSMKASQAPFLQSWVQTGSETHGAVRLSLCASVPTFCLEKVAASQPFLPSSRRSCHT